MRVRVGRLDGTFVLEVANDGVSGRQRRAGMGLRLAALEALQSGGVIEFGEREAGHLAGAPGRAATMADDGPAAPSACACWWSTTTTWCTGGSG